MLSIRSTYLGLALLAISNFVTAAEFEFKIPVTQQGTGSYHVSGSLMNNDAIEFLVDTGAGMAVLTESTFKSLQHVSNTKPSKRVAVRMADGRMKAVNVYTVERLVLGDACEVGPLDVAVIPGATKNILGMDVLKKAAPFAIYTSPPSLALSVCAQVSPNLAQSDDGAFDLALFRLLSEI